MHQACLRRNLTSKIIAKNIFKKIFGLSNNTKFYYLNQEILKKAYWSKRVVFYKIVAFMTLAGKHASSFLKNKKTEK
ncbi:hypothetical protein BpHYR1_017615 [Brachionus plicatilis]|uniref:Uncharacterized protein n=1 Tax=Brachionus plicatilis TaxID=10195 RepID=A0A3M7S608_BRAPC|nr:hypothetical protein BpHYR1_017615 [Brachionus plicatilis]